MWAGTGNRVMGGLLESPCLSVPVSSFDWRLSSKSYPAGEFSSPGSTFCADSYFGICSTPVLPQ